MTNLFNNIPDAVIMLEPTTQLKSQDAPYLDQEDIYAGDIGVTHYKLQYCNQKTDKFFDLDLSGINNITDLQKSDYQLLQPQNLKKVDILDQADQGAGGLGTLVTEMNELHTL